MIGHGDSEAPSRRKPYLNPAARHWVSQPSAIDEIKTFHQRFPLYTPTSLISLPSIAKEIGVGTVYVQDESQRCGLPSFKILGASWAIFRAIAAYTKLPVSADLKTLTVAAQNAGILLVAATDGNHGRAVARVASLLGLKSRILVPQDLDVHAIELIRGEGAEVIVAEDDYDNTVLRAKAIAEEVDAAILVQDTDLIDYEEIPQWIVDGYSTMMIEIDAQLNGKPPDLIVTPVGVGSFAQAVVTYSKKADRGTRVLSVEADTAACLWKSLHTGHSVQVKTRSTIMSGMNCGTISTNAWPILKSGVDMSVAVSDAEADEAVEDLSEVGLNSGPCGASTLAALRLVSTTYFASLGLTKDSIVLLPCTEGPREYKRTRSPDDSPISC